MSIGEAIREQGFRRWYEHQLFESHAYLVTGFLALIMVAIALEVIEYRDSALGFLLLLLVAGGGGALFLFAWRQFHRLLARAEHFAGQALCPRCTVYAKFRVVNSASDAADDCTLRVCCARCGREWTIA
jgi:hypothetical protein